MDGAARHATPYRWRASSCHFLTYSSRTIAATAEFRNLNHLQAFAPLKALLGDKPLVLDRDFYLELLEAFAAAQINFVIRLKLGAHPPHFLDENKEPVELVAEPGKTVVYRHILHKGQVRVIVIGYL